jgi:hypothetical protein
MSSSVKGVMKSLTTQMNSDLDDWFSDLTDNLISGTPVQTGVAAGGWDKTQSPDIESASTQVIITNQIPYIGVLDTGTSSQAPSGIVEPAIRKTLQ